MLFLELTLGLISQLLLQISGMEQTSLFFQQASKVIKYILEHFMCSVQKKKFMCYVIVIFAASTPLILSFLYFFSS